MAKLFIGIALVVMLATAALGFLLKGKVDALQTSRKDAISKISNAEGQAKAAKSEAEKALKETTEAKDVADKATKVAAEKTKEAEDLKKSVDEKTLLIDAKDKTIAELNDKITKLGAGGIDPKMVDELKAQVADLTTQRDNSKKELDEKTQLIESITAKGADNEHQLAELRKIQRDRETKLGLAGLQGRILAVNAGWNFVVLDVGDKKGVTVNAPLLVVRGNQPIAKLRITSVEPSTSIADVLPGSVPRGVTVQPGDTVIFQGRTPATEPDAKPAAGGVAAPPPHE